MWEAAVTYLTSVRDKHQSVSVPHYRLKSCTEDNVSAKYTQSTNNAVKWLHVMINITKIINMRDEYISSIFKAAAGRGRADFIYYKFEI